MAKMQMSEQEIVKSYEKATKKRDQIKILSELNACSREDIREILRAHGCEVPATGNRYTAKKKETPQDELKEELRMAGGVITIEDPGKRVFGESLATPRQPKEVLTEKAKNLVTTTEEDRGDVPEITIRADQVPELVVGMVKAEIESIAEQITELKHEEAELEEKFTELEDFLFAINKHGGDA